MALGLMTKRNKEVARVVLLPLERIVSNPNQPRRYFDPEALQELCRSIIANGLLQPVTVRRIGEERYELIAGERRAMAFRAIGRDKIPAIIEAYSEEQSAVLALVENLQRKDLNFFEEAAGIARLMQELGLSQVQISQRLGKAQSTVANKLRLLKYSPALQRRMLEAGLTERHARAMLRLNDGQLQELVVEYVIANRLNVEQTEQYIEALLAQKAEKNRTRIFVVKDIRIFLNTISKAVDVMRASGVDVDMRKHEDDSFVEFNLRIPKLPARGGKGTGSA